MNNMTDKEKAIAYDKALAKVRELHKDWKSTGNRAWKEIESAFPELAENEDEKIRKWVYNYISSSPNENFVFYGGVGKEAVLCWLDRLKEPIKETESPYVIKCKFKPGDVIQYIGIGHNIYMINEVHNGYYINSLGSRMDMSYTDNNFEKVEENN